MERPSPLPTEVTKLLAFDKKIANGAFCEDDRYFFTTVGNTLSVFFEKQPLFQIEFDSNINACCSIVFKANFPGLLVANSYERYDKLSYVSIDEQKVMKAVFVYGKINALFPITNETYGLHHFFSKWPHVFLIVICNVPYFATMHLFPGVERNNDIPAACIEVPLVASPITALAYSNESKIVTFRFANGKFTFINLTTISQDDSPEGSGYCEAIQSIAVDGDKWGRVFVCAIFSKDSAMKITILVTTVSKFKGIKPLVTIPISNFKKFLGFKLFNYPQNSSGFILWENGNDELCCGKVDFEILYKLAHLKKLEKNLKKCYSLTNFKVKVDADLMDFSLIANGDQIVTTENEVCSGLDGSGGFAFEMLSRNALSKIQMGCKYFNLLERLGDELLYHLQSPDKIFQMLFNLKIILAGMDLNMEKKQLLLISALFFNKFEKTLRDFVAQASNENLRMMLKWAVVELDKNKKDLDVCGKIKKLQRCIKKKFTVQFTSENQVTEIPPKREIYAHHHPILDDSNFLGGDNNDVDDESITISKSKLKALQKKLVKSRNALKLLKIQKKVIRKKTKKIISIRKQKANLETQIVNLEAALKAEREDNESNATALGKTMAFLVALHEWHESLATKRM